MGKNIQATIIIEMIGKPASYLEETLTGYIERIGMERGIRILAKNINKPKKIEKSDLLSSFAEIELEIESLEILINLIFTYMPSHIEIVSPENINLRNSELNSLANDLTRRMLHYDSIAKKMIYERRILENQLRMKGEKPAVLLENQKEQKPSEIKKGKRKTRKKKK